MNSRERILATVAHREPDRVPVGEWGIDHDHVTRILGRETFWRNRRAQTLALWQGRRDEVVEGQKRDYVDLIDALDYDVIPVHLVPPRGPAPKDPPRQAAEGVWEDSNGRVYKYAASNDSIQCVTPSAGRFQLTDAELETYRRGLLEREIDDSQFELIDFICDRYADTRAIVFRGISADGILTGPFGGDQAHQLMVTALAGEQIRRCTTSPSSTTAACWSVAPQGACSLPWSARIMEVRTDA